MDHVLTRNSTKRNIRLAGIREESCTGNENHTGVIPILHYHTDIFFTCIPEEAGNSRNQACATQITHTNAQTINGQ